MKLFDMLSKYKENDIVNELPKDITDIIKNPSSYSFSNIEDTKDNDLDTLWEHTINICESYIDIKWIDNLGIDRKELLDDIKAHTILNIYLSIEDKSSRHITIEDCLNESWEASDYEFDIKYAKDVFPKHFISWLESVVETDYDYTYECYSDFYLSFCKDFIELNKKSIETNGEVTNTNNKGKKTDEESIFELLVHFDPEIFYEVIKNWSGCPYNSENKYGMTLDKLFKFYKKFNDIVERGNDKFDSTIKAYKIERLFNISFLCKLAEHLIGKQEKDITYSKAADQLVVLKEIISIPMVFSRYKYIDIIENYYKNNNSLNSIFYLRCNLFYLNSYLIPLLTRVYYYMMKKHFLQGEPYIEGRLKQYISVSLVKNYNYGKAIFVNGDKLKDSISEELQINITEMIYSYEYSRKNIQADEDIYEIMKELEEEFNRYMFSYKYNYQSYYLSFPCNTIYSIYIKDKKHKESIKKKMKKEQNKTDD